LAAASGWAPPAGAAGAATAEDEVAGDELAGGEPPALGASSKEPLSIGAAGALGPPPLGCFPVGPVLGGCADDPLLGGGAVELAGGTAPASGPPPGDGCPYADEGSASKTSSMSMNDEERRMRELFCLRSWAMGVEGRAKLAPA
jgi:hypothetical protein